MKEIKKSIEDKKQLMLALDCHNIAELITKLENAVKYNESIIGMKSDTNLKNIIFLMEKRIETLKAVKERNFQTVEQFFKH